MQRVKLPEIGIKLGKCKQREELRPSSRAQSIKSSPTVVVDRADAQAKLYSTRVFLAGVGYSAYVSVAAGNSVLNLRLGYSDTKSLVIPPSITASGVLVVDRSILNSSIGGGVRGGKTDAKGATDSQVSPIKAIVIIRGADKECVSSFAASIRQLRPLSRYKGIGVSLEQEYAGRKIISSAKKKK